MTADGRLNYDGGHRLLATSLRLPNEVASLLLLHSDLVPGLNPGRIDGYWTGIPLPVARLYALMRTWPAPEIPRPSCVWTHAVLIAMTDMARFPDLAVLESVFVRPGISADYIASATTLTIAPGSVGAIPRSSPSPQDSLKIVRALYAPRSVGIVSDDNERLDSAIFAVWSQQWPRLRRAFSFRTAGFVADSSNSARFDLQVIREPVSSVPLLQDDASGQPTDWENVAIDDLLRPESSDFRRFLWRYGSDLRHGRDRYRFLARLYLATRLPLYEREGFA
jgi:GTPase-associated protein 1